MTYPEYITLMRIRQFLDYYSSREQFSPNEPLPLAVSGSSDAPMRDDIKDLYEFMLRGKIRSTPYLESIAEQLAQISDECDRFQPQAMVFHILCNWETMSRYKHTFCYLKGIADILIEHGAVWKKMEEARRG